MITEPILNFVVVVCVQLLFLLVYAAAVGAIKSVPKLLVWGIVIGLPFGLVIDLVWGKWVGVFTYQLGFVPWFLLLNGLFSYGVWMANVLLLRKSNFDKLYCMSFLLAVVYETTNYNFRSGNGHLALLL